MEEERRGACRAHCLALPFPTQGHLNPMLQFCKRLHARGIKVTLATTHFVIKTGSMGEMSGSIAVEGISDGFDRGGQAQAESGEAYLSRFRQVGSRTLGELAQKLAHSGWPVDCIIYDPFCPWALDVAKSFDLLGAAFFTQSCAVDAIYYHVHCQQLKLPLTDSNILLPGLPPFRPSDLPSFIHIPDSYPVFYDLLVNQYANIGEADWVLCNTFHELEAEVVDWMTKLWRFGTVGPTIPSVYLDRRLEDDRVYGLSVFKACGGACMEWLEEKADGSVVYVSFGSVARLGPEQMEELSWGLRGSEKHFVWVVRAEEEANLPKGFAEETKGKGLVVSWCSQLEVLAHRAVACFVTHSGWNSTLEALSLGVPMVAMPQWSDQSTNAKYVSDVWGIGLRTKSDEKGIVGRAEVERCIREVTEGEKGKEMRGNAAKWKEAAKGAMAEGGSSDVNIEKFVTQLLDSKNCRPRVSIE